jgi:hypothetical protein
MTKQIADEAMNDLITRIDVMVEGRAARHGICVDDLVELLCDAKDALLGLPPAKSSNQKGTGDE